MRDKELQYHAVRGKMYTLRSWIYGAGSSLSCQDQAFSGSKPNKPEERNPTWNAYKAQFRRCQYLQ